MKYHIHISTSLDKIQKGWKETKIVLEKNDRIEYDTMFTKTYVSNNDNIDKDIGEIISKYWSLFPNNTRFKIELLDSPDIVKFYNEKIYREVHFKLKINKENFQNVKDFLNLKSEELGYSISNNPREVGENYITQFVNVRFLTGTPLYANNKINKIEDLLNSISHTEYKEKKDEVSVFDTNFTKDKWWAH